jgi:hypothetical protein
MAHVCGLAMFFGGVCQTVVPQASRTKRTGPWPVGIFLGRKVPFDLLEIVIEKTEMEIISGWYWVQNQSFRF